MMKREDGNVGAERSRSSAKRPGDVKLWVEARDGYRHNLFLTWDEAERLADLLDDLLNEEGR